MLGGDFNRLVKIIAFDDVIAGHLFLGFGERTLTHQQLSIVHAHGLCFGRGSQTIAMLANTSPFHFRQPSFTVAFTVLEVKEASWEINSM
jgi:hypothetical protein